MSSAKDFLRGLADAVRSVDGGAVAPPSGRIADQMSKLISESLGMEAQVRFNSEFERSSLTHDVSEDELADFYAKIFRQAEEITDDLLSEGYSFGDPYLYPVFKSLLKEALRLASGLGLSVETIGAVGVLPVGTPNAMAVRVPNANEHVVIFQSGMALFLNRMLKIVLSVETALPVQKMRDLDFSNEEWVKGFSEAVRYELDSNQEPAIRLLDLLVSTLLLGNPNLASKHVVPASLLLLKNKLLLYVEMFVIGHEVAHVSQGHLSMNSASQIASMAGMDLEFISNSHEQEIEADIVGATIMDAAVFEWSRSSLGGPEADGNEEDSEYMQNYFLSAPDIFFSCIVVLEKSMRVLRAGWSPADTHPETEFRREIRRHLMMRFDRHPVVVVGQRFEIIAMEILDRILGALQKMGEDENVVSSDWMAMK